MSEFMGECKGGVSSPVSSRANSRVILQGTLVGGCVHG